MAEQQSEHGRSRPGLLKKAGVGGALVWAAPVVDAVVASPAAASSSGCTVNNFMVVAEQANIALQPGIALRFTFDATGCPAIASRRLTLTPTPAVPGWAFIPNSPLQSTTTNQSIGASCSEVADGTSVDYLWEFLDASDNVLCSFDGNVVTPTCVV